MSIDDFPFDKFSKYRDEKLIQKVAKYINHGPELEHILNVYAQLGMIKDADKICLPLYTAPICSYPVHLYDNKFNKYKGDYSGSVIWVHARKKSWKTALWLAAVIILNLWSLTVLIGRLLG